MPILQNKQQSSSCGKTRLLLLACLVIAIIAVISVSVLAVLYAKEIDDKKNTPAAVGPSGTPAKKDDKMNSPTMVEPSHTQANKEDRNKKPAKVGPSPTEANKGLIKLDISSSYKSIFASRNRRMMSNTFFEGSIAGPGQRQLMNYYGILADRNILKKDVLDFRFKVKYKIINATSAWNLIFDLALCNLCSIEKHWYGGLHCWDMHLAVNSKSNNTVMLYFQKKAQLSSNEYFISSTNVGTSKILSYHIYVSGKTNTISYNDLLGKHLNTFTNINFSEPLYILFGLYNSGKFQSVFEFL